MAILFIARLLAVLQFINAFIGAIPVPHTGEETNTEKAVFDRLMETNSNILDAMEQGDITLTEAQREALYGSSDSNSDSNGDVGNAAIKFPNYKWVDAIVPYVIESSLENNTFAKRAINAAAAEFASKSCIRLIPRTSESDYVSFKADRGCYSYIGRIGGPQVISLGPGCEYRSVVVHEVMHALGFFHEQSRLDRDEYVEVNSTNILDGFEGNFDKHGDSAESFGSPYDKNGIMHYSNYAFAKDRRYMTLVSRSDPTEILGNAQTLTLIDQDQLNEYYSCLEPTTSSPVTTEAETTTEEATTTAEPETTTEATTTTKEATTTAEPETTTEAETTTEEATTTAEPKTTAEATTTTEEPTTTAEPETTTEAETTTEEATTTAEPETTTGAETTTEEATTTAEPETTTEAETSTEGATTTAEPETTTEAETTTEEATTTAEPETTTEAETTTEGATTTAEPETTTEAETTTEEATTTAEPKTTAEATTTTEEPTTTAEPETTTEAETTTEGATTTAEPETTTEVETTTEEATTTTERPTTSTPCVDNHRMCSYWFMKNSYRRIQCRYEWWQSRCPKTCGSCSHERCSEFDNYIWGCNTWAEHGYCQHRWWANFMRNYCAKACCQVGQLY